MKKKLFTIEEFWRILSLFFLWRGGLLFVSQLASKFFSFKPTYPYADYFASQISLPAWLIRWGGFDGVHYLTLIQNGYLKNGLIQAFFPLYPSLVRVLSSLLQANLTQSFLFSLTLSHIFTITMMVLFYTLVKQDFPQLAWKALVLFMFFPTAFFFGAVYTESLFISLLLGSFLLARKKYWFWAGLLAALVSATKIVGVLLVPALLVELYSQKKFSFSWKEPVAISVGGLGLLVYMGFLWQHFQDPFYFLHVQNSFGAGRQTHFISFPRVMWRYLKILITARPINFKYWSYIQDFVMSLGGLGILLISLKKIRPSYLVFSFLAFLIPPLTGTFSSMPRYILVCFPIFIWLALWTDAHFSRKVLLLTISTLLLILNTILFIQGYWVA